MRPTMATLRSLMLLSTVLRVVLGTVPSGPWDAFNLAPASKTVYAHNIYGVTGSVANADALANNTGSATLLGHGSYITLDFGYEVSALSGWRHHCENDPEFTQGRWHHRPHSRQLNLGVVLGLVFHRVAVVYQPTNVGRFRRSRREHVIRRRDAYTCAP